MNKTLLTINIALMIGLGMWKLFSGEDVPAPNSILVGVSLWLLWDISKDNN